MKKKLFLIVLLICLGLALWAEDEPPKLTPNGPFPWRIWGYVPPEAALRVEVITHPFTIPTSTDSDFQTSPVKKNEDTTVVKGIKAGTYSLLCNSADFMLTVTHGKLKHESKNDTIDYRLDVFDSSNTGFQSLLADEVKTLVKEQLYGKDETQGIWGINNKAFYVSLYYTDTTELDSLAAGMYTSDITFTVTKDEGPQT